MSEKREVSTAVTFRLDGRLFAFSAEQLTEIVNRSDITPIPTLPDYIPGVINIMGDVLPVIDLRRRLGFADSEYGERSCLMIIKCGENRAAVRVDEAVTAITYSEEELLLAPEQGVVRGYLDAAGERIALMNAERIFDRV